MKIVSEKEIFNKISDRYKTTNFKIIDYTKVTKPITIHCLDCGKISTHTNCSNFLTQQKICDCKSSVAINKKKIRSLIDKNDNLIFIGFGYREHTKKYTIEVQCRKCGQTFVKTFQDFIKNQNCSFCETKQKMNTIAYEMKLPDGYSLIGDYINSESKTLIRHDECGFIWRVKPHTFKHYINNGHFGCPKCNHKRSKGEQKIENFLKNNNITYEVEKKFAWQSNKKYAYDFFLNDYNLLIEYNGQQHYEEVKFFHGTLQQQKNIDEIKENEALENKVNFLVIPYYDFNKIEEILAQRLSLNGSSA